MPRSVIIILTTCWFFVMIYNLVGTANGYAYHNYAAVVAWICTALLLGAIVHYIIKHFRQRKYDRR